jgi:hypothetical protein
MRIRSRREEEWTKTHVGGVGKDDLEPVLRSNLCDTGACEIGKVQLTENVETRGNVPISPAPKTVMFLTISEDCGRLWRGE